MKEKLVSQRIAQEAILFVAARAALIMQLAHPLVAQGAKHHSYFREDPIRAPLRRLAQTSYFVLVMMFGSKEEQDALVARVNMIHKKIRGSSDDPELPPDTLYSATDPKLLLWVWATLIYTGILVYEKFIESLSTDEKNQFVEESKKGATMLGVPISMIPKTYNTLEGYIAHMIQSGEVGYTKDSLKTIGVILYPPLAPRFFYDVFNLNVFTAALLPPEIRQQCCFRLSKSETWIFEHGALLARNVFARLPRFVRRNPFSYEWVWELHRLLGDIVVSQKEKGRELR